MAHNEIQRTNYDAALAVAIKDAERKVVEAAEAYERFDASMEPKHPQEEWSHMNSIVGAVRELRRVRDGGHA